MTMNNWYSFQIYMITNSYKNETSEKGVMPSFDVFLFLHFGKKVYSAKLKPQKSFYTEGTPQYESPFLCFIPSIRTSNPSILSLRFRAMCRYL
jgi:hypothetical protein